MTWKVKLVAGVGGMTKALLALLTQVAVPSRSGSPDGDSVVRE
jgi:hypothetical protein